MTIPAYPLHWPAGWKRTESAWRTRARFGKASKARAGGGWDHGRQLTIAEAVERVRRQLTTMNVRDDDLVISSNLELRLDGFPKSNQRDPSDPGIAVYWRDGKDTRCMAIDRYDRVADNLAAVAATLDAMRAIERHGGAEILDRAFSGFTALPAPEVLDPWWEVLGFPTLAALQSKAADDARRAGVGEGAVSDIQRSLVVDAYRRLRSQHHPDKPGGDAAAFRRVQAAYDQYQQEQEPPAP